MEPSQLILSTLILIIPSLAAFFASIYYVSKKNNLISKFLLLGSFLICGILNFIVYLMPYLIQENVISSEKVMIPTLTIASIGFIIFFISFFFHIRKIVKDEKIKIDINELNNIGK